MVYRLRKRGLVTRWVLAPSQIDGQTGELVRPHVHIVIPGDAFSLRDKRLYLGDEPVDDIWGLGCVDVQFLRHQRDYKPLADYIVNQSRGVPDEKKWTCSRNMKKPIVRREVVTSGAQLRVPAGALELPGTRYDPEKGQNFVRYIPAGGKPAGRWADTRSGRWPRRTGKEAAGVGFKKLRGKAPKRRRGRMKRGGVEEAARLAGTKWPGIAMPRRWSEAASEREGA